ncbi:MAG: hypothetical protein P8I55_06830 [Crocinitomix sp.]|nr:hypothetical protein [Crocinitomix sp.]|tara:strand:+ start:2067 stop:2675 length:609 start_codon:yes stop_codon:yes gene_type:complete
MEILALVGFFALLIGIIVLSVRFVKKQNKKKIELFQQWGLRLNLHHENKKQLLAKLNTLSGELDGKPVVIYEHIVGSGKNQVLYTTVTFAPNPFDFDFKIGKEGFFTKVGKSFGAKDIEFGDEEFDKKFLLKCKDQEDRFRSLMDFRMQGALTNIEKQLKGNISSTNAGFTYSLVGGFNKQTKLEEFEKVMTFMRDLIKNQR